MKNLNSLPPRGDSIRPIGGVTDERSIRHDLTGVGKDRAVGGNKPRAVSGVELLAVGEEEGVRVR